MKTASKLNHVFMINVGKYDLYSPEILRTLLFGGLKFTLVFMREFNKTFIEHLPCCQEFNHMKRINLYSLPTMKSLTG